MLKMEFSEGEVIIGLIDRHGTTLGEVELRVSGDPDVRASTELPLSMCVEEEDVPVIPVLVSRSSKDQEVLFNGVVVDKYIRSRCKELKCNAKVTRKARVGKITRLEEGVALNTTALKGVADKR